MILNMVLVGLKNFRSGRWIPFTNLVTYLLSSTHRQECVTVLKKLWREAERSRLDPSIQVVEINCSHNLLPLKTYSNGNAVYIVIEVLGAGGALDRLHL